MAGCEAGHVLLILYFLCLINFLYFTVLRAEATSLTSGTTGMS